jgi:hypothetical protein
VIIEVVLLEEGVYGQWRSLKEMFGGAKSYLTCFSAKYEDYWTAVGGARKYIEKEHTGKW